MTDERKTVYVNDHPVRIFLWAEVQHCVNACDSELYLAVQRGEAEIVDEIGGRIGWGGFAGDGQHIYVRFLNKDDNSQFIIMQGQARTDPQMAVRPFGLVRIRA